MRKASVYGLLVAGLMAMSLPPAVMGAGPTRTVTNLNDPALDASESAWATDLCGFPVAADVRGHIISLVFSSRGRRGVQGLDVYGIRERFTSIATGASIILRDIGPDRFFVKHGKLYVAVTGRSLTGSGVIGRVVIDLATGEIVHSSGNKVGNFYDQFCAAID